MNRKWNPSETMPARTPISICLVDIYLNKQRIAMGFLQYGFVWELEYKPTPKDHERGIQKCYQTRDGEYVRIIPGWEDILGWTPLHNPRKRPAMSLEDLAYALSFRLMPTHDQTPATTPT